MCPQERGPYPFERREESRNEIPQTREPNNQRRTCRNQRDKGEAQVIQEKVEDTCAARTGHYMGVHLKNDGL